MKFLTKVAILLTILALLFQGIVGKAQAKASRQKTQKTDVGTKQDADHDGIPDDED